MNLDQELEYFCKPPSLIKRCQSLKVLRTLEPKMKKKPKLSKYILLLFINTINWLTIQVSVDLALKTNSEATIKSKKSTEDPFKASKKSLVPEYLIIVKITSYCDAKRGR